MIVSRYYSWSAQMTERHNYWVGEAVVRRRLHSYTPIPVDAGPHPTITDGVVDYGTPVPRATWRRNLPPPTPQTCKLFKPPYKHASAQVRG